MSSKHHSKYVSNLDVIHRCYMTYKDVLQTMPFIWYVDRVEESVVRKGFYISRKEIIQTVSHFYQQETQQENKICPHCYGTGKKEIDR